MERKCGQEFLEDAADALDQAGAELRSEGDEEIADEAERLRGAVAKLILFYQQPRRPAC